MSDVAILITSITSIPVTDSNLRVLSRLSEIAKKDYCVYYSIRILQKYLFIDYLIKTFL